MVMPVIDGFGTAARTRAINESIDSGAAPGSYVPEARMQPSIHRPFEHQRRARRRHDENEHRA